MMMVINDDGDDGDGSDDGDDGDVMFGCSEFRMF